RPGAWNRRVQFHGAHGGLKGEDRLSLTMQFKTHRVAEISPGKIQSLVVSNPANGFLNHLFRRASGASSPPCINIMGLSVIEVVFQREVTPQHNFRSFSLARKAV